jgi:integrase
MVSIPPTLSGSGKRERHFYGVDEQAAKKAAGKLRTQYANGQRGGIISHDLAVMAAKAQKLLDPLNITILEAAQDVVRRYDADGNNESFKDRLARILPLGEAHWSATYNRDMSKIDRWLPTWFMQLKCASITNELIHKALSESGKKTLSTLEMKTARIKAAINYKPRHRKQTHIEIMSDEQIKLMFGACKLDQERWAVGLMIYAGIRPSVGDSEITRLDWEDVGADHIFISREVSKTNSERIIPITPALARAISGHPKSGTVIPAYWKVRVDRLRKAAGIAGKQDITRHTFASHWLAWQGEESAKSVMGHTANSRTLFEHYRRAITKEAGEAFFK